MLAEAPDGSSASRKESFVTSTFSNLAQRRFPSLRTAGLAAGAALLVPVGAFAQTAGIGAQTTLMAQEAATAGGNVGSMAMYLAALMCLVGGAWALWQSRQPNNRESGKVAMGLAGIALCGLFATGGVWIGKAAQTASGGAATIAGTNAPVVFGGGAAATP